MQIIFPFKGRDLGYLKDVEEIHQTKSKNKSDSCVKQSHCLDCDGNETAMLENNTISSVISKQNHKVTITGERSAQKNTNTKKSRRMIAQV